jgi:ribosomal-protein-alanine N-acetyltransferase
MVDLELSRMTMIDLDDIMEIEEEAFSMPWSRWMFERELVDNRSNFLVARSGSAIVGYIGFWLVEDEAHIVTIAVRSDFRRKGVGSVLIASALALAVHVGADKATLEVRVTNIPAQELYKKFGFEAVAIRRRFYSDTGEDAYVMWLRDLEDKLGEIRAIVH